jgi:hypothetical protein
MKITAQPIWFDTAVWRRVHTFMSAICIAATDISRL